MAAGEDDLGLDLRLPWGRPQRAPPPAEITPPAPHPVAAQASNSAGAPRTTADHDDGPARAATMQLQRHLKVLLRALGERFDRLDRLEQRIDDVRKEFQERFDRLENLLASDKRTFDPGARVADPSLSGTDAHSDSLDAALARVSDLEALVKSSHRLTMEALAGTTSGTMLNRVDQRLEAVANELHGGVGRIDSRIDEAYVALMKAITGLPSATLIRELPDGVVATGTMLDDELMEVRRTLTDRALTNTENSGQPPGPPVSPTEPG